LPCPPTLAAGLLSLQTIPERMKYHGSFIPLSELAAQCSKPIHDPMIYDNVCDRNLCCSTSLIHQGTYMPTPVYQCYNSMQHTVRVIFFTASSALLPGPYMPACALNSAVDEEALILMCCANRMEQLFHRSSCRCRSGGLTTQAEDVHWQPLCSSFVQLQPFPLDLDLILQLL
jgi:hypothetical protein